MLHRLPDQVLARMRELEEIDARDRTDGTPRLQRLRQVPRDTGRFIALMALCAPEGACVEVGTSAGYSTMWLALACQMRGRKLTTFEVLEEKVAMAKETLERSGLADVVQLVHGDAREHLGAMEDIGYCFLDAEKEVYGECYELVVPRLVPEGLLVADNAINHREALAEVLERADTDERVDAMVMPVGKGELVVRRI